MLGHVVTECGDGIHEDDKCDWGDFLRVMFEPNIPPGPARPGGNRGGFAGRGRGRMRYPGEANEAELVDMEVETDGDPTGNRGTRKRIIRSDGTVNTREVVPPMIPRQGIVANQVNLLENGTGSYREEGPLSTPQKFQQPKRQRHVIDRIEATTDLGSATSTEEDHREQ
jgi:hypothetical protein